MTDRERWETLQTRWAQGDALSPEEEEERLAIAVRDAAASRELEIFVALRARAMAEGEPVSREFVDRVLAAVTSTSPGFQSTKRTRL